MEKDRIRLLWNNRTTQEKTLSMNIDPIGQVKTIAHHLGLAAYVSLRPQSGADAAIY